MKEQAELYLAGGCFWGTEHFLKQINVVGLGLNQWVAIDFADVLVHVFLPETRAFYDLENLWEDAKLTKIPNID